MIRKVFTILMILLMAISFTGCDKVGTKAKSSSDSVAIVNGEAVSKEYFNRQYSMISQQYSLYGVEISKKQFLKDAIIPQTVLVQKAKEMGIKVSKKEVTKYIDKDIEKVKGQMSEEQFQDELDKLGVTLEELKADNIVAYSTQLYIQGLLNQTAYQNITVSKSEMKDYYNENIDQFSTQEQVQASHILVAFGPEMNESEAYKKILEIQSDLQSGTDFAELAKETSDCPSSEQGGDLGFFSKGMMVPEFEEAAFSMDIGDVSGPVKTQFGYHIIKVTDKKEAGTAEYKDVKDTIESSLLNSKKKEAEEAYIKQLVDESEVEIFLKEETAPETTSESEVDNTSQDDLQKLDLS